MKAQENGQWFYNDYNKKTETHSLSTVNEETGKATKYTVNIDEANEDYVKAIAKSDTGEEIEIDTSKATAQLALTAGSVIVLGGILGALLKAILLLLGAILIGGVMYYTASAIDELKRKQPQIRYYLAKLYNSKVYIGPAFTSMSKAAEAMRQGVNIFATSQGYAYDVCKSASPISEVINCKNHRDKDSKGKYYSHYHQKLWGKNQGPHCWFR